MGRSCRGLCGRGVEPIDHHPKPLRGERSTSLLLRKVRLPHHDEILRGLHGALTATSKGQVTLRKQLLGHLCGRPGQRLDVEVLPGGAHPDPSGTPKRIYSGFSRPSGRQGRLNGLFGGT